MSPRPLVPRPQLVRQLELVPDAGLCQRWRDRKARWYRDHVGAPRLDRRRYHVEPITQAAAAAWLARHHYLRTLAGRQWLYGLLDDRAPDPAAALVGVAVFGPGMPHVLPALFPGPRPHQDSTELVRFGLLDTVPADGETHFLGPCSGCWPARAWQRWRPSRTRSCGAPPTGG